MVLFSIDANGTLRATALLDYEAASTLAIRVQTKDDFNATVEGLYGDAGDQNRIRMATIS